MVRILLGAQLRRLRKARGMSVEVASHAIGAGATYLGLEQTSSVIRTYQPQVIPDLLQTEDVARALQRLRHPK